MVGANVFVREGKKYLDSIGRLKQPGLNDAIHTRRIFEPGEGVELVPHLFTDSVVYDGAPSVFKYLFLKDGNNVFLLEVKPDKIDDATIAWAVEIASRLSKPGRD